MVHSNVLACSAIAASIFANSHQANAAIVRWDVEGTFGIVIPPVPSPLTGLAVDDRVVVSVTFDSDVTPDTQNGAPVGDIATFTIMPLKFSILFPDLGLDLTAEELVGGTPKFVLGIGNNTDKVNPSPEDIVTMNIGRDTDPELGSGGVNFIWAGFAPTSFLSSTDIPTEFSTSDFDATQIVLGDAEDSTFRGGGTLSKFTAALVPAPGMLGFCGLVGFRLARRRPRRSA